MYKLDNFTWRVPREGKMRVDGIIFANDKLMESIRGDQSIEQVKNVATLPGIVGASYAMPDIHWGYGFPIGGVAAFDPGEGVVSPGGVGYDINCGVRLLRTNIEKNEILPKMKQLVEILYRNIPSGVGAGRKDIKLNTTEVREVLKKGARWGVEKGYGWKEDLERIESSGTIPGADPSAVSERAIERGRNQVGTLGSGNHFIEVEFVEEIFNPKIAEAFGLFKDQICVHIHSGSRGLGYQVCDDSLEVMLKAASKYGIELVDRQLCCAPLKSPEARAYLAAMSAAANFAFCNRQLMAHFVRQSFESFLNRSAEDLGMHLVYDIAHNIAKFEEHTVEGQKRRLCVHRKGATRAFPPGHPDVPPLYRDCGQPVLIPGDMGRYSFVCAGTQEAFQKTFGSSCHGAGRMMSRVKAKKAARGRKIYEELAAQGIIVRSATLDGVLEEIPEAYKDVADVVDVVQGAGLATKVARLRPIGVIKG
ncbi:MAG: RtcB family protein [Deltaproteobacteria bacterium]|nr:RtcB family protein [Deltaproteobacteria bacterium]